MKTPSKPNAFFFERRPSGGKEGDHTIIYYYRFNDRLYVITSMTPQDYIRMSEEDAKLLGLRWLSRQRRAGNLVPLRARR